MCLIGSGHMFCCCSSSTTTMLKTAQLLMCLTSQIVCWTLWFTGFPDMEFCGSNQNHGWTFLSCQDECSMLLTSTRTVAQGPDVYSFSNRVPMEGSSRKWKDQNSIATMGHGLTQNKQGCQRVRITLSDLPESPVEKNWRIWIYWSVYFRIPITMDLDLTGQFTGDPPVCLCQHYIDCISGTADFWVPITACHSLPFALLPIIPVCSLPAGASICLCHCPLVLNLISCKHLPSDISHKYYYYYENEIFYTC